ncbi:FtsX-like permease family protein [Nonomuraea rubra]|uniref:Putative ABC transport system permease protein n=1 Tax=Nonomuraea rubra TaxID=46180 RepID=A0A7X0P5Q6_9ACTN|nr:FtsX-like permease family protein [Nonomuraea rubra]MBB6555589.1 putative ABC transport system permease protein [Nonomuraea rubra]
MVWPAVRLAVWLAVWLAGRTLRRHPGSALGALVTLVVAAAMVSAFWFVIDSAERARPPVERYAGVPLVVGTGGVAGAIPPELVAAVKELPEVGAAVPEITFPVGPGAGGHGWSSARLTPFRLVAGRPPRAAGEVVVDTTTPETDVGDRVTVEPVGVGDQVKVEAAGVVRSHRVVGVAAAAGPWRHQRALFFTDDHAAALAGRGTGVDALGVYPRPGVGMAALEAVVGRAVAPYAGGGVRIATGAARALEEGNGLATGSLNAPWFLLGTTVLVATGMVAAALGLSVRRRGRELAVLRAIGAYPRQLRRMLLAEGLILAAVATAGGVPLGALAAPVIADRLRDFGTLGTAFELTYRPQPALWTLAFTVAVALAASLMAGARTSRIRPGDALGEAPQEGRRIGRGRLLTGLALAAVATVLSALQLGQVTDFGGQVGTLLAQFLMFALVVAAAGLVAPWAVLAAGRLVRGAVGRVSRVGGFLATANVLFNHRRFAGAVGAITLGVTLAGVVTGTQSFYDWRAAARAAGEITAGHVLLSDTGLSPELLRDGAVGLRAMPVTMDGRTTDATVVTGDVTRALGLPVRGRPLNDLREGEVALRESLAARTGAAPGTRVRIRFPGSREPATYTVAAVYRDTSELASLLFPGLDGTAAHLAGGPYLRIYTHGEAAHPAALTRQEYVGHKALENAGRNRVLPYVAVLIALFSLVAAVNGLCLALFDRGREFVGMRRLGMGRGQVTRMACWESVLTVVPVLVLALAATVWTVLVCAASEPGGLAALVSFIPFGWLAPLGAGAILAALAGSVLAVRAAMRDERQALL